MALILMISILLNVALLVIALVKHNSVMAILAYIRIHRLPMPSDAEMMLLCAEAWRHMFTKDSDDNRRSS